MSTLRLSHRCALALVLGLLLAAPSVRAQSDVDQFRAGTLNGIARSHLPAVQEAAADTSKPGLVFTYETFPTKAPVRFQGTTRSIRRETRDFIAGWLHTFRGDTTLAAIFTEEWLFRDGDVDYWLPVQTETAESMRRRVRKGDLVWVYTRWIGARVERGQIHWMFLLSGATSD